MRLVGFLLLFILLSHPGITSSISGSGNCDRAFDSQLTLLQRNGSCLDYQLTLNYIGPGIKELSKLFVEVPCGAASNISLNIPTSNAPLQAEYAGLTGFSINQLGLFGGKDGLKNFAIYFTICTDESECACSLSALQTQVIFELISSNPTKANEKGKGKGKNKDKVQKNIKSCTQASSVQVAEPLACIQGPTARLLSFSGADAEKACPGQRHPLLIEIDASQGSSWQVIYSNGTDNFPLTIDTTSFLLEVTQPGTYSLVSIEDALANPGTVTGSVEIIHHELPTATLSGNAILCPGDTADLTVALTGQAPWTLSYSDGTQRYQISTYDSIYTFQTPGGQYTLESVTDANCTGTVSGTATITAATVPTAVISGSGSICEGELANLQLDLTGTAPWVITYADGLQQYQITTTNANESFQVNQTGTYSLVTVKDAYCSGTVSGSAVISKKEPITGRIYLKDQYCYGNTIYLATSVLDNGYTYQWETTGAGILTPVSGNKATYDAASTDKAVTFTVKIDNGCNISELSGSTEVVNLNADFTIIPDVISGELTVNTPYTFSALSREATAYYWNFGDGSKSSSAETVYTYPQEGFYLVSLAMTKGDCNAKTIKEINVISGSDVYVANTLLSSGTETSTVQVQGENISENEFSFTIYDQWGTPVYETTDPVEAQKGWNGKSAQGRGKIFTYTLRGYHKNGKAFEQAGRIWKQ